MALRYMPGLMYFEVEPLMSPGAIGTLRRGVILRRMHYGSVLAATFRGWRALAAGQIGADSAPELHHPPEEASEGQAVRRAYEEGSGLGT